jgi:DNA-binding MarR family transcriptional regulator
MTTANSPTDGPALQLVEAFAALIPNLKGWVESRLERNGVSYARLRLLGMLHYKGPQIMSGLSHGLGVTARNITSLVDALETEGLVRRQPHPVDRRATIIEMTDKGKALGCQMLLPHKEAVAELFRDLSVADQKELLRLIGLVREALEHRLGAH